MVAQIGDSDPIAYGGAFVYEDTTGVYCPEMSWFLPGSDSQWNELGGKTPLKVYRILLERDSRKEWWFDQLDKIKEYTGQTMEDIMKEALGEDIREKACLYDSLIHYFGSDNFDSEPQTMTEDEAYAMYAEEMKFQRR